MTNQLICIFFTWTDATSCAHTQPPYFHPTQVTKAPFTQSRNCWISPEWFQPFMSPHPDSQTSITQHPFTHEPIQLIRILVAVIIWIKTTQVKTPWVTFTHLLSEEDLCKCQVGCNVEGAGCIHPTHPQPQSHSFKVMWSSGWSHKQVYRAAARIDSKQHFM